MLKLDTSAEFCKPSTSNSLSCIISEQVELFAKAKFCTFKRGSQKQGKC